MATARDTGLSVSGAPVAAAYRNPSSAVLLALQADPQNGLSVGEAQRRLEHYGPNQLKAEAGVGGFRRFLAQFQSVLVLLLLAATAVSTGTWWYERDTPVPYEALAILAVVLVNALLGYVQESRAESAVAAIARLTAAHAQLLRGGKRCSLEAEQVVPGDILLVEAGDQVTADARVLETVALQTAEAALTGESVPVAKSAEVVREDVGLADRSNMLFAGTAVTYGRGRAVVTATGMRTEMGRIAGLMREVADDTTPLQKQLDHLGKLLGVAVLVIAVGRAASP